jgi:actin-related protein 5
MDHTYASITTQKSALLTAFKPDYDENDPAGTSASFVDRPCADELTGRARIHLTTERWKVCEAWFSPNIAGVDSAGIGEVLQSILSGFDDVQKRRLVQVSPRQSLDTTCKSHLPASQNVFITGGPSQLRGLSDRLYSTLRPILSPDTNLRITSAANPVLDAWKGMSHFASSGRLPQVSITRAEYDEWGGERVKRWWGGNWNASVPP